MARVNPAPPVCRQLPWEWPSAVTVHQLVTSMPTLRTRSPWGGHKPEIPAHTSGAVNEPDDSTKLGGGDPVELGTQVPNHKSASPTSLSSAAAAVPISAILNRLRPVACRCSDRPLVMHTDRSACQTTTLEATPGRPARLGRMVAPGPCHPMARGKHPACRCHCGFFLTVTHKNVSPPILRSSADTMSKPTSLSVCQSSSGRS